MKLPTIDQIDKEGIVVLRLDLDLPIENGMVRDDSRLIKSIPTVRMLLAKNCKLIIIGHLGRPDMEGSVASQKSRQELSLKPVYVEFMSLLENGEDSIDSVFLDEVTNKELIFEAVTSNQIVFLENLRFYKEEVGGNVEFFGHLAEIGNMFVNDALAVAHRKSASMMLFKMMPVFYGLGFAREVEEMSQILIEPKRPIVLILGGVKEDKLDNLDNLSKMVDVVLVGGKLPIYKEKFKQIDNAVWANLDESGMDIDVESIEKFKKEIEKATTIVLAGSMGKFEDRNHENGTFQINKAVSESDAVKIGAGGDTKLSLSQAGVEDKFDYVCSGGGVLLEFLANNGQLPAWEESVLRL